MTNSPRNHPLLQWVTFVTMSWMQAKTWKAVAAVTAIGAALGAGFGVAHAASSSDSAGSEQEATLATFGAGVDIPIDHTGDVQWVSDPLPTIESAQAFGVGYTVSGDAVITREIASPVMDAQGNPVVQVTFHVASYSGSPVIHMIGGTATAEGSGPTVGTSLGTISQGASAGGG